VDVNADGWLDLYVCNAGYQEKVGQENALFLNNGDMTFREAAAEFGLAENGYTTHAAFVDYDLDGDLDVYLLNNSFIPVNTLNYSNKRDLRAKDWPVKEFLQGGGDKLLRNDGGTYVDVSEEAGMYGSLIGFGLGITVGDVNGDRYPDLYVSNDFFERDYLYINQQDGTFQESLTDWIQHISHSSMGADMADINNDGKPEIFVTDMLPDDEYRLKTTSTFDDINLYQLKQKQGFYHQYMHNTLQLNDENRRFQEISHFSGVQASDWSWGALMFDADNDRYADIFVCNGIYNDVIDQDFIDFFANEAYQKMALTGAKKEIDSVISKMPSVPIANKFFHNQGNLTFEDVGETWGLDAKTFSNGAAYGDLDNDGDLDLVINNVNQPALLYQNQVADEGKNHSIRVLLKGQSPNTYAIGAKVSVFLGAEVMTREVIPSRGFQSSTDYVMTIGVGDTTSVDRLEILWPDQQVTILENPSVDQLLEISYSQAQKQAPTPTNAPSETWFTEVAQELPKHEENQHVDFYYDRNVPTMVSQEGPRAAVGDVDGDGDEDVFIGGAAGQAGVLYLNTGKGLEPSTITNFDTYQQAEDVAAAFFDADADGDLDLFVGSGGNEQSPQSRLMQDRLYKNDGKGELRLDAYALPPNGMNTSVIIPYDYDGDGDQDIFVGSRSLPANYGLPPESYLYENLGGRFANVALQMNEGLPRVGMVTDAMWVNVAGGPQKELVVVGDWMPPRIFMYNGTEMKEVDSNLRTHFGMWYTLEASDVDQDGDMDLLLGNIGENFYLKGSAEAPLKLWVNDFDGAGSVEKIITRQIAGKDMPVPVKRDLTNYLVSLKKQNLRHSEYAKKSIQELFDKELLDKSLVLGGTYLSSCIALNQGDGSFDLVKLPANVQLSCVNDALFTDLNGDGYEDILLGGNNHDLLPQFSRLDASVGHTLLNQRDGTFQLVPNKETGLYLEGELKQFQPLQVGEETWIIALINNQKPVIFTQKKASL
ncbi:MAG: CRTAC1 family protein, partial [Bacteroidota bacterium]